MLVDAIDAQAVEHVERTHPLGVTLGEVVVDGHHMHTVAGEGVEEHGQSCHEGLTFTRRHLGNLALMQHDTTEQLHVVVNHVPGHLVTTCNPVVVPDGFVAVDVHKVVLGGQVAVEVGGSHDDIAILRFGKTACRVLHDGIYRREHLGQSLLEEVEHRGLLFVNLLKDRLALVDVGVLNLIFQFGNLCALVLHLILQEGFDLIHLGAKLVVGEFLNVWLHSQNLLNNRANLLDVAVGLVAEKAAEQFV